MSKKPLEYDRRYGELDQVMRDYLSQPADDTAEQRSRALDASLRYTWHTRPWAIAEAERRPREYCRNPPGRLRTDRGVFCTVPDIGIPESAIILPEPHQIGFLGGGLDGLGRHGFVSWAQTSNVQNSPTSVSETMTRPASSQ